MPALAIQGHFARQPKSLYWQHLVRVAQLDRASASEAEG